MQGQCSHRLYALRHALLGRILSPTSTCSVFLSRKNRTTVYDCFSGMEIGCPNIDQPNLIEAPENGTVRLHYCDRVPLPETGPRDTIDIDSSPAGRKAYGTVPRE